ncbi:hypothetical protein C9E82_21085 [Paracoccus siganidrum]|uniref:DUF1795 domain-containing protein n=2 Tax=Paracoccus siganidrum TaxID=1276757 RepID=A0A419ACA2_9RHOB|nr:DUF1795 domain-containing protein [Paracoccus siganidrum]RMC28838.1 hypothetical protein C9E82_21085 [Paracoccus siganidrum]
MMYQLNEGSIDLPADWKDQSINILSASRLGEPGLSLTVTRDDIPWGMSFQEYVDDQMKQAKASLKDFTIADQREVALNGHAAVQLECRWVAKQGPMHQIITTVLSGNRALVLTASMPGEMSATQRAEVQRIIGSLRLSPPGA